MARWLRFAADAVVPARRPAPLRLWCARPRRRGACRSTPGRSRSIRPLTGRATCHEDRPAALHFRVDAREPLGRREPSEVPLVRLHVGAETLPEGARLFVPERGSVDDDREGFGWIHVVLWLLCIPSARGSPGAVSACSRARRGRRECCRRVGRRRRRGRSSRRSHRGRSRWFGARRSRHGTARRTPSPSRRSGR